MKCILFWLLFSGSCYLPKLDPLAAADEQARTPALPQEPDDEEDPEGAPRLLWLQVPAGQGPGYGGGQSQGQGRLQLPKVSYHLHSPLTKISYFGNSIWKSFSEQGIEIDSIFTDIQLRQDNHGHNTSTRFVNIQATLESPFPFPSGGSMI